MSMETVESMEHLWEQVRRPKLRAFLRESLMIEGIHRAPTDAEEQATAAFLSGALDVASVLVLQAVYAPGMPLRSQPGMDVRVGGYIPPRGNPYISGHLEHVLNNADPWILHVAFERLHPFMDGNGRTGRAVWAWQMQATRQDPFALSFLHRFYYQTLAAVDRP